jgi:hypothetical protein
MPARVIAFINYKGGVAKTTTTYHVGCSLAQHFKKRVLLVDIDPQTNLTFLCGAIEDWERFKDSNGTIFASIWPNSIALSARSVTLSRRVPLKHGQKSRAATSPALRDHQARAAQYTADLKFLELEEKLGRLMPVAEVQEASTKLGETVVRVIERLPTFAEAISSAAIKDGAQGARVVLRGLARQLRTEIAEAMGAIGAGATPWTVDPISGQYIPPSAS